MPLASLCTCTRRPEGTTVDMSAMKLTSEGKKGDQKPSGFFFDPFRRSFMASILLIAET